MTAIILPVKPFSARWEKYFLPLAVPRPAQAVHSPMTVMHPTGTPASSS